MIGNVSINMKTREILFFRKDKEKLYKPALMSRINEHLAM